MDKITEQGLYECGDADYNSDPCEEISLRSSIAWKLIEPGSTPAHAAWETPRLNPRYFREEKREFNIGSAAHALLFGRGKQLVDINGYDYQRNEEDGPKAAEKRQLRDLAYSEGKIPLLIPEWRRVREMEAAAKTQIAAMVDAGAIAHDPFSPEYSEKVLIWRDHGVLCRAALDGLSISADMLSEYKTDGQSAHPEQFQWKARKLGYLFRLAFYRRGLEALKISYSPSVCIFAQETYAPYLMALIRVEDEVLAREDTRVLQALKIWRRCIEKGEWPGYSRHGFDLGLTEREQQQEISEAPATEHMGSEDISASLTKPTPLFPGKRYTP